MGDSSSAVWFNVRMNSSPLPLVLFLQLFAISLLWSAAVQESSPGIRLTALNSMEDYEYFAILQREIAKARKAGEADATLDAAEKLLDIPETIVTDLTHFSRDPAPLHAHRRRLADAIERMGRLRLK